jgi:uncharacterized protein (TIGR03435 family)
MRTHVAITTLLFFFAPAFAQTLAPRPEFDVASVKRNLSGSRPWLVPPVAGRLTATNVTLRQLIGLGWPGRFYDGWLRVAGGPSWIPTDGYDVSAIAPDPNVSPEVFSLMMQNLLKDRFSLKVHIEMREAPIYALVPAKGGLRLPGAKPESCVYGWKPPDSDSQTGCAGMNVTPESITNEKISMRWFASVLGSMLERPVVDKTGFAGSFKVDLQFAPVTPGNDTDSTRPSIFTALEEQLGLRLQPQKGTEKVLVIDHVERPSEN